MSFSLEEFARIRPQLYHLTALVNLDRIRRTRALVSASMLLAAAGRRSLITSRRRVAEIITLDGDEIHVRDQAPLYRGNMELAPGWVFEDFVAHLNARIFFWPGDAASPISYGVRHYERYRLEPPAILRIETRSLFEENPHAEPLFCRYNSGSPRCSYGRKSPRNAETFITAAHATFSAAKAVEVTFEQPVTLPTETVLGDTPRGPWVPFYHT